MGNVIETIPARPQRRTAWTALFAEGWAISPLLLFLFSSFWFLWLFPTIALGVERDSRYDQLLLLYFAVQFLGLAVGQRVLFSEAEQDYPDIGAPGSFFRACWWFWWISILYKSTMLLTGGLAKYLSEEAEIALRLPYVNMLMDSMAFRVAPFMPWVATRGRITPLLILAICVDFAFGLATLTKEYPVYVVVAGIFGMTYWRRSPGISTVAAGIVATVLVFLLGPAQIWTRATGGDYTSPLDVISGVIENTEKTLLDDIERDITILAVQERFDLYSSGLLAVQESQFDAVAERCRDALPFFWVPRSEEKEITFRSGNYLGAAVGLAEEGGISGIAFPNAVLYDAMFGRIGGLIVAGTVSYLFGAAYRWIRRTRCLELWIGYLLLYTGFIIHVFTGRPVPAFPYMLVYVIFSFMICIFIFRTCKYVSSGFQT